MKKIARYFSIMMIAVLLTGCEETSATIQSTISDSVEVNQVESGTSNVTSSVEADKTVEKSEIETQVVQTEVIKGNSQGAESSIDDKTEEHQVIEPSVEAPIVVEPTYDEIVLGEVAVDSIITFGRYEQDNNPDNGPEPIEWHVIEINEEQATLIPVMCLMWGTASEADTEILEMYDLAFNESEKNLIISKPHLLAEDMLDRFLTLDRATSNSRLYKHDSRFLFEYTESVLAEGATPSAVTYPGFPTQTSYRVWTETKTFNYTLSSDPSANFIIVPPTPRNPSSNNEAMKEAICPYIVIKYRKEIN